MRHAGIVTWCFRVRADIRETSKLECATPEWVIEDRGPGQQVRLISRTPGSPDNPVPLSEARSVVLRGSGYSSEEEAAAAGQLWRARLMRAFAAVRIGADFGDRAPQGGFTVAGLTAFGPPERRSLNDVHGLTVFECEPAPIFLGVGPITAIVSSPHERLVQAMDNAIETGELSEERQVTYDLFAASFGQRSADARFALLMMALESLIDPAPRPGDSRRHVQSMIEATEHSGLAKSEINSIKGALSWLLDESIGQAGRRLARTLEPRRYKDEAPAKFFTHCYELRSRLMHGLHPLPTRSEIDSWAAPLEVFVADLLSEPEDARGIGDTEDDATGPRSYGKLISRIIRYLSGRADRLRRR
jgi:hypothetical protein